MQQSIIYFKYPYVKITVTTWLKQSYGAFDFRGEQQKYDDQYFIVKKSKHFYRNFSNLKMSLINSNCLYEMPPQQIYLFSIDFDKQNKAKVQSGVITGRKQNPELVKQNPNIFHDCFIVVKDYNRNGKQGYPLKVGNILKFGTAQFQIIQKKDQHSFESLKETSHLQLNTSNYQVQDLQLKGNCRICLTEEETQENPLINPCLCKGSCQLLHVSCLKDWINSKITKKSSQIAMSFNFSKFFCQICKATFPKTVTLLSGQVKDMIKIQKPTKPYLMMESIKHKKKEEERILHLLSPDEDIPLRIGRGENCEIMIDEGVISQVHSSVVLEDNEFILKDKQSKYGTFVKFQSEESLSSKIAFQYNRIYIKLQQISCLSKDQFSDEQD